MHLVVYFNQKKPKNIKFMDDYKRYKLKQDYTCGEGTLIAGSDIDVIGDRILYNGGMIEPQYYPILANLVKNPELNKKYLKEVVIPYNKI